MRKVIVSEIITLDGFFAGPDGAINWHIVDEDFNRLAIELLGSVGMLLFGRVTYELMVSYWPTEAAATDDPIVAEKMNTLPKVVFSKTLETVEWGEWKNARLVKGDLGEEIAKLKQEPGKDMVLLGSGKIVSALASSGLIDEYVLFVTPIVLGNGIPLFKGINDRIKMKLVGTQNLSSGVVLLRYQGE